MPKEQRTNAASQGGRGGGVGLSEELRFFPSVQETVNTKALRLPSLERVGLSKKEKKKKK